MTFYPKPTHGTKLSPTDAVLSIGSTGLKHAVTELCKTNFLVFQKVELGMEIGPQHRIWWDHLKTGKDVIELAPRDHGKSHSLGRAYPLWKLKYDPWIKEVLILGADQPSAVDNLDKLREMVDGRESVRYLLPVGRTNGMNSRTEIRLTNGKVIKAKGWGSPLRGRHPQLIVLDDVLNEENSWSKENRKQTKSRFNDVVVPMKDKGIRRDREKGFKSQIVGVGTAQDHEDLYHDLLKNPNFIGAKLQAVIDAEKQIVLWGDRYSYDDLMALKETIGSLSFSKEYQNNPLSDETTIFPTTLFEPLFDPDLSYAQSKISNQMVFIGVDFSVPGSTDGDWTVIIALEYNPEDHSYTLLNYWRERPPSIQDQINKIEYYCQTYNASMAYLEDNMFQGIYRNHFEKKSSLPVRGHTVTGQNKRSLETGVLSLRTIFENGLFRFPYKTPFDRQKTDYIVSEFNGVRQRFGKIGNDTTHDDVVMAMWHAVCASRATVFEAHF